MPKTPLVPTEVIERRIHIIRRQKIMLDRDLAKLYDVTTTARGPVLGFHAGAS